MQRAEGLASKLRDERPLAKVNQQAEEFKVSDIFYASAEIRWFLPTEGGQWDQIMKWFTNDDRHPLTVWPEGSYDPRALTIPFVKQEYERTDAYLVFPECETVGVKRRQGKLEVKALAAGPRPFALSTWDVAGRWDQWVKWSFGSGVGLPIATQLKINGPWRSVQKDRYLQKYSFDSGHLEPVSPEERPGIGCNLELTKIAIKPDLWEWLTLGFEAFGPSARSATILEECVAHFFAARGSCPVRLREDESLSYPRWLTSLRETHDGLSLNAGGEHST